MGSDVRRGFCYRASDKHLKGESMNELKECPFCGNEVRYAFNLEMNPYGVVCSRCHMVVSYTRINPPKPHEKFERVLGEIAEAWNRRDGEGK